MNTNQLPEVYLERVIKATTVPGDWIFDPFNGTGTTATVGLELGRNAATTDVSLVSCREGARRAREGAVRC